MGTSLTVLPGTAVAPDPTSTGTVLGVAPEYLCTLVVRGDDTIGENGYFSVSTSLDESFSLSMGSSWSAPFANVMQEGMQKLSEKLGPGGQKLVAGTRLGMQAAGVPERTRVSTAQVWESSDAMSFSIPFTFVAQKDPKVEVADKIKNMLKLAAPSEILKGTMLRAPGPSLVNEAAQSGRRISLYLGTFLALHNCIVTRVDVQCDSLFGAAGIPLKAKVNVDINSFYTCFTTVDIENLFNKIDRANT